MAFLFSAVRPKKLIRYPPARRDTDPSSANPGSAG